MYAEDIETAVLHINKNVKWILITSGRLGNIIIPQVQNMPNLESVVVFCGNKIEHSKWAKNYSKVIHVTNSFEEMLQLLKN